MFNEKCQSNQNQIPIRAKLKIKKIKEINLKIKLRKQVPKTEAIRKEIGYKDNNKLLSPTKRY